MHENQGPQFDRNYIIAKAQKRDEHGASFQSSPKVTRMLVTRLICIQWKFTKAEPSKVWTWENSHLRDFHNRMTFWFRITFTWWLGHFASRYLKVHFMLLKYTCDSKSQTLRTRYPFQSTGRPISHRNEWSFRVYMTLLQDFVPEWDSRPGTRTGLNSRLWDSRRHDILWWYHVNKYRAMRGNRSELAPGRKSPRCHVMDGPLQKLWGGQGNFRAAGIFFRSQIPCMNFFRPLHEYFLGLIGVQEFFFI